MANGSTSEGKTAYELEKQRIRFSGSVGQNQGTSKILGNQFIYKAPGTFAYAVHVGKKSV